ncbi:MAG: hypothetical protein OER90_15040 [Gemmatimonadota bacterium]|nr:hypothetical protein [Gemmatimonadota bacterium]
MAVALASAAILAYQVLLVRVLAIVQFYHFAYMAIGVAMLGFGASGTLLTLIGPLGADRADRWFARSAVLTALAFLAAPVLAERLPIDATQLLWHGGSWLRLGLIELVLAAPLLAGAMVVLLGIRLTVGQSGLVYGVSFFGSGLGAVAALSALWIVQPQRAIGLPAVIAALGALAAAWNGGRKLRLASLACAVFAIGMLVSPVWRLDITPYKALPQIEAYPGAERVAERFGPTGWVVAVEAPAFRHAPGLSLGFSGTVPAERALFVDGDLVGATPIIEPTADNLAMLDWLPSAAPYAAARHERVLVLGAGSGTEVRNATAHGARAITAVELVPDLVALNAGAPRAVTDSTPVRWVVADARSFVARTRHRYDLVVLGPAGQPGATAAGVHALGEDFLHTVEAYVQYLRILDADGMLAVTGWLTVPPRGSLRSVLTAAEALRRVAPSRVPDGLVVLRSWGTVTVLAKPAGFTPTELQRLEHWATERQFEIDWRPGLEQPTARYHALAEPTVFAAARAATSGVEATDRFADEYAFDVLPATDARPYPHHFLRPESVPRLLVAARGEWWPFAEWGHVTLLATLGQGAVVALLLLLAPIAARVRRSPATPVLPVVGYFAAIGLAYLATEIATIQAATLLLGHPVFAVVAVLTLVLTCSGFGSLWSDRMGRRAVRYALAALVVMVTMAALGLLPAVHALQPLPLGLRAVATVALVAPVAIMMGIPFPAGVRIVAREDQVGLAWAWAANGFASVVAAPLAALIALEWGSSSLLAGAALIYAMAAAVLYSRSTAAPLSSAAGLPPR